MRDVKVGQMIESRHLRGEITERLGPAHYRIDWENGTVGAWKGGVIHESTATASGALRAAPTNAPAVGRSATGLGSDVILAVGRRGRFRSLSKPLGLVSYGVDDGTTITMPIDAAMRLPAAAEAYSWPAETMAAWLEADRRISAEVGVRIASWQASPAFKAEKDAFKAEVKQKAYDAHLRAQVRSRIRH